MAERSSPPPFPSHGVNHPPIPPPTYPCAGLRRDDCAAGGHHGPHVCGHRAGRRGHAGVPAVAAVLRAPHLLPRRRAPPALAVAAGAAGHTRAAAAAEGGVDGRLPPCCTCAGGVSGCLPPAAAWLRTGRQRPQAGAGSCSRECCPDAATVGCGCGLLAEALRWAAEARQQNGLLCRGTRMHGLCGGCHGRSGAAAWGRGATLPRAHAWLQVQRMQGSRSCHDGCH